ncbi:MAG: helix-turn-helix domain-containing protein [Rhodocyclaceae bacterium]
MGTFVPSIGERLLEERERLGLSQSELAERCGVTMRSQRNYEKGERQPDASYLAALATARADVLYVLTGERWRGAATAAPQTDIDAILMARVFDMLDRVAKEAGKRWTEKARLDCAVRVYNFLVKEEAPVTEERMERVLRLVVNR